MTILRELGNILVMLGYPVLLYSNPILGASMKTVGHGFLFTYFLKYPTWDMLTSIGFFSTIDLIYLIKSIRESKEFKS
ncbi:MAG: hypothetical protein ACRC11_01170 [Xenococcaceae cyanobacterium]